MPHMIPAYEFRRRARLAMKQMMPILLVVALIAALPSLIQSTVTLIANANPDQLMTEYSDRLMQVLEKHGLVGAAVTEAPVIDEVLLAGDIIAALEQFQLSVMTFLQEKGLLVVLLALMVAVCSPVLTLGLLNALLHALRRQEFTAAIALSRMKYILKAVGLMLMFALRLLVWMLPGFALMIGGIFLPQAVGGLAMIGGLVVSLVMGVIISYRYGLITFFLADDPTMRIRNCFRRSGEVMQRRKMELFSLEVSFIGWHLVLSMVQSLLLSFGAVIGLTLGMFASLFLTVYTNCAKAAFYQEYAVGPLPEAAEEAPSEDDLL